MAGLSCPPRLMPRPKAAEYLGIGTTKFDELRKKHSLQAKLIDSRPMFDRFDLDELADSLPYENNITLRNEWDDI